jgi:hypothetical protein
MYIDIRHESRANITFHNMAKVSIRGTQNYLVKWFYNHELFGEMFLNSGQWGAYPINDIGDWKIEFWQENQLMHTYTNILEKNNILIIFENSGDDFGDFVKKIKKYSDDIANQHGCNVYVFFKNSELCDFSENKAIPLRLNDHIDTFKIIYNKTL